MIFQHRASVVLVATLAMCAPVSGQTLGAVEQRLSKLENSLQSVERKLGKKGAPVSEPSLPAPIPQPSSVLIDEFSRRLDALDRQVALMVSQGEEIGFAARRSGEDQAKHKADTEFRLLAVEEQLAAMAASMKTLQGRRVAEAADIDGSSTSVAADTVETDFAAARAFADAGEWNKAEFAFSAFLTSHGSHPRAPQARYWQGQSFLAQGKAGQAAKAFLDVFQTWPKDPIVLDSLFSLGAALLKMEPSNPVQACAVFDQIDDLFGTALSPAQGKLLLGGRVEADCESI